MSGFIIGPLPLAVYCYFLRSLYKDREAIQTVGVAFAKKHVKQI